MFTDPTVNKTSLNSFGAKTVCVRMQDINIIYANPLKTHMMWTVDIILMFMS